MGPGGKCLFKNNNEVLRKKKHENKSDNSHQIENDYCLDVDKV
jgi:hypothetical protein